jgi:hypothetical protein
VPTRLTDSPLLARLRGFCRIRIDDVPDDLVREARGERRNWLKAALLQQSCRLAARLDAKLFILDPAAVYSENYLGKLCGLSTEPHFGIVLSRSYRTDRAGIVPAMQRSE